MDALSEELRNEMTREDIDRLRQKLVPDTDDPPCLPVLSEKNNTDDLVRRIRYEAERRKVEKERNENPTTKQLETLHSLLEEHAVPSSNVLHEGDSLIDFTSFMKVNSLVPHSIRRLISPSIFARLKHIENDLYGRVSISSIYHFIVKKVTINRFLIMLSSYSDMRPMLTMEELNRFLEEEVMQPMNHLIQEELAIPQEDGTIRKSMRMVPQYYHCLCEKRILFLLDPLNIRKIRIADLISSGIVEQLFQMREGKPYTEDIHSWFSLVKCEEVLDVFRVLDEDHNGLLSKMELMMYCAGVCPRTFIEGVFRIEKTFMDEGKEGEVDFNAFVTFVQAMEERKTEQSLRYLFRALDVEGKGFVNRSILEEHVESLLDAIPRDNSILQDVRMEDIVDEIFDISRPTDPTRITIRDIIVCGKGDTILGILTDYREFIAYELRETTINEDD